jgi:hypothetical protein
VIVPARPALSRYCVGLMGGDLLARGRRWRMGDRFWLDVVETRGVAARGAASEPRGRASIWQWELGEASGTPGGGND